jgi:hypothetical protein
MTYLYKKTAEERMEADTRARPDLGYEGPAVFELYGTMEPISQIMSGAVQCTGHGNAALVEVVGEKILFKNNDYAIVPGTAWVKREFVFLPEQEEPRYWLLEDEKEQEDIKIQEIHRQIKALLPMLPVYLDA